MEDADYIVVSTLHHTITVHRPDALSERFSLFRFDSGDVHWRLDEFDFAQDPRQPAWMGTRGSLAVADVVRRLPAHAVTILEWTRREIELGNVIADDIFIAVRREEALTRLRAEIDALVREDVRAT